MCPGVTHNEIHQLPERKYVIHYPTVLHGRLHRAGPQGLRDGSQGDDPLGPVLHQHVELDMLPAGLRHVRAVVHDKHGFVRLRKNLHLVSVFVPGPAADGRRPREKAGEGGRGVGARSEPGAAGGGPASLSSPGTRASETLGRAHARSPARTRARACAPRPLTPLRLLPFPSGQGGGEKKKKEANRKRAELIKWRGKGEEKKCLPRLSPISRLEEWPGRPEKIPKAKP